MPVRGRRYIRGERGGYRSPVCFPCLVLYYDSILKKYYKGESMVEFKNVTIIKKANIYFDGKVTSRTVVFAEGSHKTLGIMFPGEYSV